MFTPAVVCVNAPPPSLGPVSHTLSGANDFLACFSIFRCLKRVVCFLFLSRDLSKGPVIWGFDSGYSDGVTAPLNIASLEGGGATPGVSGVNYLCLLSHTRPLQLYINPDPRSLKEAPAHMNPRQSTPHRMPLTLFLTLLFGAEDPKGYIKYIQCVG